MAREKISEDESDQKRSPYTRVTSVLNYVDSSWYGHWLAYLDTICDSPVKEAKRIGDETAAFGTQVHKIVEGYLRGTDVGEAWIDDRAHVCAGHIVQWIKEVGAEVAVVDGKLALEFEVIDEELMLIGHFDALFLINGVYWIIDWKSSSKMRKSFPLQKSAYAKMLEKKGIHVDDGATIRVDRDPAAEKQFEVKEYHGLKTKYWPVFLMCLKVYQFFNNKGEFKEPRKQREKKKPR